MKKKTTAKAKPLSKKEIATLKKLAAKANIMIEFVKDVLANRGEWHDGKSKGLVFKGKNITARKVGWSDYEISSGKGKCRISDGDLASYLNGHKDKIIEADEKARANVRAKALKTAKKFAKGKSQDEMLAELKAHITERGLSFVVYVAQKSGNYKEVAKRTKGEVLQYLNDSSDTYMIGAVSRFDFQAEKVVEVYLDRKPKEKETGTTYMDVLRRIANYMSDHGGYNLQVGETNFDSEYESSSALEDCFDDCKLEDGVSVQIGGEDDGGEEWLGWDSVEDFCTADFDGNHHANTDTNDCVSIFELVSCWEGHYYKLVSRPSAWFVDNLKKLAEVDTTNTSPTALMKALDAAGI